MVQFVLNDDFVSPGTFNIYKMLCWLYAKILYVQSAWASNTQHDRINMQFLLQKKLHIVSFCHFSRK